MSAPGPVPEEVTGGWDPRVRVFRAGDEVDVAAVVGARHVVLVDTMSAPEEAEAVLDLLADDVAGRSLVVVNTHQHYDHTWGNAAFDPGGRHPAPIVAHTLGAEIARSPEAAAELARRQAEGPRFARVRIVAPTVTVDGGAVIDAGGLTVELVPTPGHTRDHLAAWIPEIRTLLAGDAAEHPFPYAERPEDLPELVASLDRLAALDPAVVIPCHGGTSDPGLLLRNLDYFAALRPGVSYEAALRPLGLRPGDVPALYEDFHRMNVAAAAVRYGSHEHQ
ncbi:MAG TPA: MBL fold metallo-hydrolase [Miltoncostaeaceae bacterium]|nr:MBL fold metallo-hydrolase [Miltoncostaeaceae bacterium]